MRKLLLTLVLGLGLIQFTNAQNKTYQWSVGINAGISEYSGDLGNGFLKFDLLPKRVFDENKISLTNSKPFYLGINASKYYNQKLDFNVSASFGENGIYNSVNSYFYSKFLYVDATARWKFLGGENAKFTPYLLGGIGLRRSKLPEVNVYNKKSVTDAVIPLGIGMNITCDDRLVLNIQSQYGWTSGDKVEGNPAYTKFSFDQFWHHSVGISYLVCKGKTKTGTPSF